MSKDRIEELKLEKEVLKLKIKYMELQLEFAKMGPNHYLSPNIPGPWFEPSIGGDTVIGTGCIGSDGTWQSFSSNPDAQLPLPL